jgi:hypothetical protein
MAQPHSLLETLSCILFGVGQNYAYIHIHGAYTVFLAGKLPCILPYTMHVYGSGQPYSCMNVLAILCLVPNLIQSSEQMQHHPTFSDTPSAAKHNNSRITCMHISTGLARTIYIIYYGVYIRILYITVYILYIFGVYIRHFWFGNHQLYGHVQ